ncbi:MAG TPA: hypothetical protein VN231_09550 [Allosphingosinicella sp.]|nr:hypothetical protein [Allosphingosinicella sp.]
MKRLLIAALLAAHVPAAGQPVPAAEFTSAQDSGAGAFAGLRVRVPLGGDRAERRVRAGLMVAPTLHSRRADGSSRTRIGEGLELGLRQDRPLELTLAGTRVDRLGMAPNGTAPDGRRAGVSTLGWVAIGVGAVLVVGLTVGYLWIDDALDCDPEDECN